MSDNYFLQDTKDVEHLAHFPYKNFVDFQQARKNGEIVDFGIAMDYARQWVTGSKDAPKGWMYLSNFLMLLPYIFVIFYIVVAFVSRNYWLFLYSPVPFIFQFFANPLGRKLTGLHYVFLVIYVVLAFFINPLWSALYWLPLVIIYLALNQLYGGSAQIIRDNLSKNEKLLCLFWKWWDLVIYTKDNIKISQRYHEVEGKNINYYEDVEKEWKEYVDLKYK